MNWLVFHIVSGHSFFTGIALVITAAILSTRPAGGWRNRLMVLCATVGLIALVVSSTAIPYGYYVVAGAVMLVWTASAIRKRWRRGSAFAVVAVWMGAVWAEAPYHITGSLRPVSERSMAVIGDSISAGMGGQDTAETWPRILARTRQLAVHDLSQAGETTASARKRVQANPVQAPVVVVEIGGNDLLGTTPAAQFADDLDALLAHLSAPDRQIVMFELPLPPFYHQYGRAQRVAASKHRVILIPRRVLLSVLAGKDATLDTIHLTQAGHQSDGSAGMGNGTGCL
jgi:acyl-CoA thioesterase I